MFSIRNFVLVCLLYSCSILAESKDNSLESKHYRVYFPKGYEQIAGEVLEIAEQAWFALAKAYESYNTYEKINIILSDRSDDANGMAIYTSSHVEIFVPPINWNLRGRRNWLENVVTHELAHIFSLRRAAYLAPIDLAVVTGATEFGDLNKNSFGGTVFWVPLVAPTWWVEGIAQLEADENGYDRWDSQRDMLLRDAWKFKILPSLSQIETFGDNWNTSIDAERVYNTGFGFLRYLRERYGMQKVRKLAFERSSFNFDWRVKAAFGKPLIELYDQFLKSLDESYADFSSKNNESIYASAGNFNSSITFSKDGRYEAWISNDHRDSPMDWVVVRNRKTREIYKSGKPISRAVESAQGETQSHYSKKSAAVNDGNFSQKPEWKHQLTGTRSLGRINQSGLGIAPFATILKAQSNGQNCHEFNTKLWKDFGNSGLEFHPMKNLLLTARQDLYSSYTDLWEYDFKTDAWHRLTWEERAYDASYRPDGKVIVFAQMSKGSSNIAILDSLGIVHTLTHFAPGQMVFNPKFNVNGDSIYFSYGKKDKEAIAVISSEAKEYNSIAALRDSSAFPDSLNIALSETIRFVTPLNRSTPRDLGIHGDTLIWSENRDGVYNVYMKKTGDSVIYQLSDVVGQALQPVLHNQQLYYQGFQKKGFHIIKSDIKPQASYTLDSITDSLPRTNLKKLKYSETFNESSDFIDGMVWEILPYLSIAPRYIRADSALFDASIGANLTFGSRKNLNYSHQISAEISLYKPDNSPPNYRLSYASAIGLPSLRHNLRAWNRAIQFGINQDVINNRNSTNRGQDILDPTEGFISFEESYKILSSSKYQQIWYQMALPEAILYPYFNWSTSGWFWRRLVDQSYTYDYTIRRFPSGELLDGQQFDGSTFKDATFHRHFSQGIQASLGAGEIGKIRPKYISLGLSARKYWTRYMDDAISTDSLAMLLKYQEGKVPGEFTPTLREFNPYNIDITLDMAWSWNKFATAHFSSWLGSHMRSFPLDTFRVQRGDTSDNVTVSQIASELYPISYHLSRSMLQGYPMSLRFKGEDLMEGQSIAFARAELILPFEIRTFLSGLPLTSLTQLQFTFFAEGGSSLPVAFDGVQDYLSKGKNEFLSDVGLRASLNFLAYHQYPYTIYVQFAKPINNLQAEDFFYDDYAGYGFSSGKDYLEAINSIAIRAGFEFGRF